MNAKQLSYSDRLRWRNRGLVCLLVFMIAYMIVIGEMGWGDSRIMSRLANDVSRLIFFGGMIWIIYKIVQNSKAMKSQRRLKEQMMAEMDEGSQYLHDKSGGFVWDAMFVMMLFVTFTTSLINMPAFYTALSILAGAVLVKITAYFWYRMVHA